MRQTILIIISGLISLTGYSQEYPVSFQLPDTVVVKEGNAFTVTTTFKADEPWYIYAPTGNNAAQGMIETNIIYQLPKSIGREGKMQLPEAKFKGGFEVYEGSDITFSQTFMVNEDAKPGEYKVHAKVTYQTCNEKICLPPVSEEREIRIIVGEQQQEAGNQKSKLKSQNKESNTESAKNNDGKLSLRFTAIDGREVDLSKLKGKLVLIDCWATWCRPCIAEFANIKAMYDKYHDKGFEVIGISMDEEAAKQRVKDLIAKNKLPWPQGFEGKGFDENSFVKEQKIASLPTVLLIDREGNIVDRDARGERLEELIKKYL